MRRPDGDLLSRLDREQNVWLCTLRADGSPHLTPVWFVYRPDSVWFCVGERTVKVRNLARDPRVSLALEDGLAPAVAEGSARPHTGDCPEEIVAAFLGKYDWDIRKPLEIGGFGVLYEVPVTRWLLAGAA
ncbi:pyridoxamine 5'-phosphate oxidase [Amycolatopsis rhizosphaerae]|uniref:Pyridoxamine 5'-phosphate oxidase n=1 Tax=Amycolatopsis rhizosphaerae TaxID=2053003 RepID=A0A558D175_9PSEU|nr:pyridoxamine 5'-phosphate oxidase family protein [Amycolatopsis rhizosphaerae]TVT54771.1 pyridoxamine 5'-phosphate oxidase [Amycolatopsis rhizosphaerae]